MLAEKVFLAGADEVGGFARGRDPTEMADDSGGAAGDFSHDQFGGGGELVGGGDDGGGEDVAVGIGLPAVVNDWLETGDADGDVGEALAPGTAKGVGDEHGHVGAGAVGDLLAQAARGGVGIAGQQRHPAGGDVRRIDAGVGADEAMMRLDDNQSRCRRARIHADDAAALLQDDFNQPGVFLERESERARESGGFDGGELDEAVFSLGDDFLRNDEHVAVGEGHSAVGSGLAQQLREWCARGQFREAAEGVDLQFLRGGAGGRLRSRRGRSRSRISRRIQG